MKRYSYVAGKRIIADTRISMKLNAALIGGTAGSFLLMGKIFASLPTSFRFPIIVAFHRLKHVRHGFVEALNLKNSLE